MVIMKNEIAVEGAAKSSKEECMRKILLAVLVVASGLAVVSAAVSFQIGPSYNLPSDSRISGMGSRVTIGFDVADIKAGYFIENQNLTVVDAQNSANSFALHNQLTGLSIDKEVASIVGAPVSIGLELGSLQIQGLAGTVAAPAAISQVVPVIGINGGISYESAGKGVTSSLYAIIGYQFADITDTAVPAGFVAGGANFKDLNGLKVKIGVGLKF